MIDKRQVAGLIQRAPWLWQFSQMVYRLWQPWVTVGAVGAVMNARGQLLIVEHVFHPMFPWGLPGGWMARNEEPQETVRREILEETALRVEIVKPLLITQAPSLKRHLDVAYLCLLPPDFDERMIHLSSELLDYQWCDPQHVPPMALFHRRVVQATVDEHAAIGAQKTSLISNENGGRNP
jgi:8-oxo-dGTP diphosphatase